MTLGALCRALDLGADPEPIVEAVRRVYDALEPSLDAASEGLDLPCAPGCAACCHEAVFVCAPEFLVVAQQLETTHTLAARTELVQQMRDVAAPFADELEMLETMTPGPERDEVATRVRFRCPLLGPTGLCDIYPARELNARTFGKTWDGALDAPYGCDLTVGRLRVLGDDVARRLPDARAARRRLAAAVPRTALVHVFPWWFDRYGDVWLAP